MVNKGLPWNVKGITWFFCSWCGCRHKWKSGIGELHQRLIKENDVNAYRKIAKSLGD